ncbi:MAG: hypothetical protein ACJZ8W_12510, partial [Limisphaerales bacterium]
DRLAVLESFHSLDTFVADQCFAPVKLDPQQFESPRAYQLATRFMEDMIGYDSAEQLAAFINTAKEMIGGPQQASPQVIEHFSRMAGSQAIINSEGDPEVLQATYQIANQRLQQLHSRDQIQLIRELATQGLDDALRQSGILVTDPTDVPSEHDQILRYWELTGTRYLLCQTGNQHTSNTIRSKFPNPFRPVYINALNAVLDPVKRRFESAVSFEVDARSEVTGLKLRTAPEGPLTLVVFKGALPRVKLYADWRSGLTAEAAAQLVYSPGFIPALQVALHGKSLTAPEHPARTEDLAALTLTQHDDDHATLNLPPTDFATVLLINNTVDSTWEASIDGNNAPIHRANLNAAAVHLPASAAERTIKFTR